MLTHFSPTEQVKRLASWVYHFFLYTVLVWIVYNILLSPVWGEHLYSFSEEILRRKEFLDSRGVFTSPSLNSFKDIPFATSCAVGSIYGFFLINLPIALFMAFGESILLVLKNKKIKIVFRILFYILFLFIFYETLSHFCTPLLLFYGIITILVSPICISKIISGVHFYAKITNTTKSKYLCSVLILFFISTWLTHPVWDIIQINPSKYDGVNKTTLFRDWLLLDSNGKSTVNDWYYNNTVYASESEKITVFQPLVVGYVDLNIDYWKRVFYSHFASDRKGVSGQPILYVKFSNMKDAHSKLDHNLIDYLAIDAKNFEPSHKLLQKNDNDRYGYFDYRNNEKLSELKNYYHPHNYYGKTQLWSYKNIVSTPLTRITSKIRNEGYSPKRNRIVHQYRLFLKSLLSNSNFIWCFILPMLLCLIYFLFTLICLSFQITPWIYLILIAITALPICSNVKSNIVFWNETLSGTSEYRSTENIIFSLHKASRKISDNELNHLLSSSLNNDKRIAMWQINTLGNSHPKVNINDKKDIEKWLLSKISNYHSWPLNVRYKYIEACSKVPTLHPHVERLLSKEKHLYIRWYGEHYGFGKDDMNNI